LTVILGSMDLLPTSVEVFNFKTDRRPFDAPFRVRIVS